MRIITDDANLGVIMEQQYYLASKGGISLMDSNNIPDFERELYVGLLMKDLKNRKASYDSI